MEDQRIWAFEESLWTEGRENYQAKIDDEWLQLVGLEVKSNSTVRVNMDLFDGQFERAVDGWAVFECERVAEDLRDEYEAEAM